MGQRTAILLKKNYGNNKSTITLISNYITNKKVKTDDKNEDIWDSKVRVRYGKQTDNNNGLMLIEVTQKYDDNGNPRTYGDMLDVKVGFCLGYEGIYYHNNKLNRGIELESEFVRLVSMEEYVTKTWRDDEYAHEFVKACRTVMKLDRVEEVYDEEGAKQIEHKQNHIHNCIEALTKDLPEGQRIDVPKELLEKDKFYV